MQKSEIVAKIEEARKTLADLQEQLEKGEGWWEPVNGEDYFFISSATTQEDCNRFSEIDKDRIALGNFYRTKEEAQKELNRRIALTAMRKYIAEEGIGWRGETVGGYKFYPVWRDEVNFDCCGHSFSYQADNIYIDTSDNARQFIKDQESNIKIYFGV